MSFGVRTGLPTDMRSRAGLEYLLEDVSLSVIYYYHNCIKASINILYPLILNLSLLFSLLVF